MTARRILLTFIAATGLMLTGCANLPPGGGSIAFEDCYNRPPLYQREHGCHEGR